MKRNALMLVIGAILLVSLVLTACQPVVKTVEVPVTEEVVTTEIVEVEKEAFTTPHPILSDVRVRQAMAYCVNKLDLVKSVYPFASEEAQQGLVMDSFIQRGHWAYAGDENISIYPFDPEKGKALLDEAGWKYDENVGWRVNEAGDTLALKFSTTSAAFRQTWAAVFEKQMANCGIQILRFHVPADWWFGDTTGLGRRDFELGAFAWVGQADPSGQTLYSCNQIPSPKNGWEGQNYMGWCNEAADINIKKANNTIDQTERAKAYGIVQAEYTKDVPALPLFNRTESFAASAGLTGFAPTPGEEYYTYNVHEWEIPGKDTIVIGLTQEPASLFNLVEDLFNTRIVTETVDPRVYTSLNYNFEPYTYKANSDFESGNAANNDVEVKEGDLVVDVTGTKVELKAGVKVFDKDGAEVEYAGTPVTMKQLVVTYEMRDDLKWSDGEPLKQADLELGYRLNCDKESGATTFITCENMKDVQFEGLKYTVTYFPGVQDPFYYLPPLGYYPSHQVLSDGRVLADVPAKEWATLPEIAETPLGVGPYKIVEWSKGQYIKLEANPYFFKGEAKTKYLIFSFVTAENAEAQLLTGQVDVLGSETLAGLTEQLIKAEEEGKIVTYVIPGGTWEHVDFNLWLK